MKMLPQILIAAVLVASSAVAGPQRPLILKNGQLQQLQAGDTLDASQAINVPAASLTGTVPVANGGTGTSSQTGSGSLVFSSAPTLTSPAITGGTASGTTVSGALAAPTGGTLSRTISQHMADEPNVLDYGADPTGTSDSAAAFNSAIAAAAANSGIAIHVPKGTYKIGSIPWGSAYRNIRIDAEPGVAWTGAGVTAGTGQLSTEWIFGHPLTNPWNATSGPSLNCYGLPQAGAGAPGTNVTQCWSTELSGKRGAGAAGNTGLLGYIGIDNGDSIDNGNVAEAVNIVTNIHNADNPVSNFGGVGLEIDMNIDVACRQASGGAQGWTTIGTPNCSSNSGAADNSTNPWTFTGVFVDSGGAGGPLQASLGGIGMQVKRDAGAWNFGFSCLWADTCFEAQAYNHALTIHTAYQNHTPNDPFCPSGSNSSNCAIRGGIFFDNAPYWANTLLAGAQLANGSDAIVLSRTTDSGPSGSFLRFRDHANSTDLFMVGATGSVSATGSIVINGAAGSYRPIWWQTSGSGRFEMGTTGEAETGSNAGSNFYFNAKTDGGASNHDVFNVNRATGVMTIDQALVLPAYNVSALPASPVTGEIVMVKDANSPTWGSALTGGGSTKCIALYNGSAWVAQ